MSKEENIHCPQHCNSCNEDMCLCENNTPDSVPDWEEIESLCNALYFQAIKDSDNNKEEIPVRKELTKPLKEYIAHQITQAKKSERERLRDFVGSKEYKSEAAHNKSWKHIKRWCPRCEDEGYNYALNDILQELNKE